MGTDMKQVFKIFPLMLILTATAANADCAVEYKAKHGTQYVPSVMHVPDNACSVAAAQPIVAAALQQRGIALLAIVKVTPGG